MPALGKPRKERIGTLVIDRYLRIAPGVRTHREILRDGEPRENATAFRNECESQAYELVRGLAGDVSTFVRHAPSRWREPARERFQRRRLAGAICTDQR